MRRFYALQVDLYDTNQIQKMRRQYGKMLTRNYEILPQYSDLAGMDSYFSNKEELKYYKDTLFVKLKRGRNYSYIGEASRDSLYELETLGVGTYTQGYVWIADFSKSLDYVLHRLYRCNMEQIRKIEDYDLISGSIMNCNFSRMDSTITFERLLHASDELLYAIGRLSKEAKEKESLNVNNQVSWMIFQFYKSIISELHDVKYYTMMMLCAANGLGLEKKGVIRSNNFSSIVATASRRFDGMVTIHQKDSSIEDYQIAVRSYAPYEYLGEVIRNNEFTWKI